MGTNASTPSTDHPSDAIVMTARQQQVAQLAAKGLGYKEMGTELGISPHTARSHIIMIANKLPGDSSNPLRRVMRWMLADGNQQRGVT